MNASTAILIGIAFSVSACRGPAVVAGGDPCADIMFSESWVGFPVYEMNSRTRNVHPYYVICYVTIPLDYSVDYLEELKGIAEDMPTGQEVNSAYFYGVIRNTKGEEELLFLLCRGREDASDVPLDLSIFDE